MQSYACGNQIGDQEMCNQKLYPGKQRSEKDQGRQSTEQFHSSEILWQKGWNQSLNA